MIAIHHYVSGLGKSKTISITELSGNYKDYVDGDVLWIDLASPTAEEESRIFDLFLPVHFLTREDITRPTRLPNEGAHLPKVEEFPEYLFVIANPLPWHICRPQECLTNPNQHMRKRPQLSAVLTRQIIVTHHYDKLMCVEESLQAIAYRGELLSRGPDYVLHLILDKLVDDYAPVIERFMRQLSRLETRLLAEPGPALLTRLLRLKRRVITLRKTLIHEREVLAKLMRAEFDLVTDKELHYYRNVYDHLVRYSELVETAREMVSDLMQMQLAATSNRLNEVMKVLTMISTVVLPMTLVAGVYGMNFDHMPELHWLWGYPFALVLMVIVGLVSFGLFKWRRWL